MKKVKLNSKLSLNKETIANLNNTEMNNVKGGASVSACNPACTGTCAETWNCCTKNCLPGWATYPTVLTD